MDSFFFKKKKINKTVRGGGGSSGIHTQKKREKKRGRIMECEKKGMKKVCIEKCANGMTFLFEPSLNPVLGLSCICLFVNIGSSKEPVDLKGVSHIIEHMLFKGTKNKSKKKLIHIFDSIGARFNAYTNKCLTCFYIICDTEHLKACLDAFAEMVIHATFDEKEMEKEQKVVHEEAVQLDNNSDRLLNDGMDMALFEGSNYAIPIDYIHRPLNRKKVMDYYYKSYLPTNMALSIVSSASYDKVKQIVFQNQFSMFHRRSLVAVMGKEMGGKMGKVIGKEFYSNAKYMKYQTSSGIELVNCYKKGLNNVKIAIGFRICPWKEVKDREIFRLIKRIFYRGLNGRLFVELRNKHGLAYSPKAGTEYFDKMGKFGIYSEIETYKLIAFHEKDGKTRKGVLPILFDIICEFIKHGPTKKELEDVKGHCHGEEMLFLENIVFLADYNGTNYWLSNMGSEEEMMGGEDMMGGEEGIIDSYRNIWKTYIEKISIKECNECIAKYFIPSNMCVALVGSKLPSFQELEKCIGEYFL